MPPPVLISPFGTPRPHERSGAAADAVEARTLLRRLRAQGRLSPAEMLTELRRAFPHAPLSVRLAALAELSRQE